MALLRPLAYAGATGVVAGVTSYAAHSSAGPTGLAVNGVAWVAVAGVLGYLASPTRRAGAMPPTTLLLPAIAAGTAGLTSVVVAAAQT